MISNVGTRMKGYEEVSKGRLVKRMPVAVRIDGKAFHSFTRGFDKPYDRVFMDAMRETAMYLCKNIQGCVLGYVQSDEITLVLVDYQNLESQGWFDYEVQKICSVSASMATMAFNKYFVQEYRRNGNETYYNAIQKGAMFDARCFNIPKEEVANMLYWRQMDAVYNSIQSLAQSMYSVAELRHQSCKNLKKMLKRDFDIDWDALEGKKKWGTFCVKDDGGWSFNDSLPLINGSFLENEFGDNWR